MQELPTAQAARETVEAARKIAEAKQWEYLVSTINKAITAQELKVNVTSLTKGNEERLTSAPYNYKVKSVGRLGESEYQISW